MCAIGSDGVSVMLGKNNGVAARLRTRIHHLLQNHCVAHRLALTGTGSDWGTISAKVQRRPGTAAHILPVQCCANGGTAPDTAYMIDLMIGSNPYGKLDFQYESNDLLKLCPMEKNDELALVPCVHKYHPAVKINHVFITHGSAIMGFNEVKVNGGREAAYQKEVTNSGISQIGINSGYTTNCYSISDNDLFAYWEVDLGLVLLVEAIYVYGSNTDSLASIQYFSTSIRSTKAQAYTFVHKDNGTAIKDYKPTIVKIPSGKAARFVRLSLEPTMAFVICGVRVFVACQYNNYGPLCANPCGNCLESAPCDLMTGECPNGCAGAEIPPQCSDSTSTSTPVAPAIITPEIHCTSNCYPLVNPQLDAEFYVNCSDCSSNIVSYKWNAKACHGSIELTCIESMNAQSNSKTFMFPKKVLKYNLNWLYVTITTANNATGDKSMPLEYGPVPADGDCLVNPLTGMTPYTLFNVTCSGFEVSGMALHYTLSVSKDQAFQEGKIVHTGDSPSPTGILLDYGEEANGYKQYLQMKASVDNGAASTVVIEVTVTPFVQVDEATSTTLLEALEEKYFSDTSPMSIDTLIEIGNIEQATSMLGIMTEAMTLMKIQNTMDTSTTQKLFKKKQTMTTAVVNTLTKIDVASKTDQIKSVVDVLNQVTEETEHLVEETEVMAVDVYRSMADDLNEYTTYQDSSTVLASIAKSILKGSGRILDMWTDRTVEQLYKKNVKDQSKKKIQEKSKTSSYKVLKTVDSLFETVKKFSVVSETTVMQSPTMTVSMEQVKSNKLADAVMSAEGAIGTDTLNFKFPSTMPALSSNVFVKMLVMEKNPYVWDDSAELVTSPILSIGVDVLDNSVVDVDDVEPVAYSFPLKDPPQTTEPSMDQIQINLFQNTTDNSSLTYSIAINVLTYSLKAEPGQVMLIDLHVFNISNSFVVIKTDKENVTDEDVASSIAITSSAAPSIVKPTLGFVDSEGIIFLAASKVTQTYYISVVVYMNDSLTQEEISNLAAGCILAPDNEMCVSNVNISVLMVTKRLQCLYWDEKGQKFSGAGCKVAQTTTTSSLDCECKKMAALFSGMTAFTSSFLVIPNFIDPFGDAALFLTFFDNPVVVTVVIMVWILYFFIIHWARQTDKKDLEQVGVIPCRDNNPSHRYCYVVSVVTGWWKEAGTTANVFICLKGSKGQTSCRSLNMPSRLLFQTGSDDSFLIMTEKSLGDLEAVTLWHDNSGNSPHWYLSDVIIRDLRQDKVWTFIYMDWLAIDRGSILRTKISMEAVTEEDLKYKNKYNFLTKSSHDFRDSHLWLSIFSKPARSTFTRVQRVTCGLFLLLTTMLTNIMFYGILTDDPEDQVQAGGIVISVKSVMIGLETSLLMFPLNLLVMQLFQNVREKPRINDAAMHMRQRKYFERISEVGSAVSQQIMQTVTRGGGRRTSRFIRSNSSLSLPSLSSIESSGSSHVVRKTKSKCLPWWCLYIAWFVVILLSLVASYFTMLYGLKYGYDHSVSWLVSFFTGFTQGALITQPLKIVVMAVIITLVFKKAVEFDDYGPEMGLDNDEQYLHTMGDTGDTHKPTMEPLSQRLISQIKERLHIEWLMNMTLRDIGVYVVYLAIVITVVYGDRDIGKANRSAASLEDVLALYKCPNDSEDCLPLPDVSTVENVHDYLDWVVSPALAKMVLAEDNEMRDSGNFLLTTYRIRQQRIVKDTCSVGTDVLIKTSFVDFPDCVGSYEMSNEDTGYYKDTWNQPITDPVSEPNPWTFQSSWKLKTIPYVGNHATYSGGGYVLEVLRDGDWLESEAVTDLLQTDWIDDRTRSLYVEFTVYNPNSDLFSAVMIVFEFTNSGGIFPRYDIFPAKLYQFRTEQSSAVIVSRYLFVAFSLALLYYEIKRCRKLGRKEYFSDLWSYFEILIILLSFVVTALFIQRLVTVTVAMNTYRESSNEEFVSFYPAIISDFALGYATAFLVALVTIKAAKLIRFHKATVLIVDSLSISKGSLISITCMTLMFSIGCAHFTLLCFGTEAYDFKTFTGCLMMVLSFAVGEIDQYAMRTANRVLGYIYFVFFIVCGIWTVFAFFVIILNLGIFQARHKQKKQKNQFPLFEYIHGRVKLMF